MTLAQCLPARWGDGGRPSLLLAQTFLLKGLSSFVVPKTIQDERIRVLKDFQFHALLGRGGFGSVFLATETSTGLVVAIKRIAKNTIIRYVRSLDSSAPVNCFKRTAKLDQIRMELSVLKQARIRQNRWIVQLHYSFQDEHFLYLAMQFCPGGDLKNFLDNVEGGHLCVFSLFFLTLVSVDEQTARLFAAEICFCVHQLHALGYVHRDLKPDNFLISQRGHLKLADFGLSVNGFLEQKERRHSAVDPKVRCSLSNCECSRFLRIWRIRSSRRWSCTSHPQQWQSSRLASRLLLRFGFGGVCFFFDVFLGPAGCGRVRGSFGGVLSRRSR